MHTHYKFLKIWYKTSLNHSLDTSEGMHYAFEIIVNITKVKLMNTPLSHNFFGIQFKYFDCLLINMEMEKKEL